MALPDRSAAPASAGNAPLPAPQAVLICALAQGVLGGNLDWTMLEHRRRRSAWRWSLLDEFLGARKLLRLPPLGVCIGIYLPMSASHAGGVRRGGLAMVQGHGARRPGTRPASNRRACWSPRGLIVGESLFGVALAGVIVATGKEAPLALVPASFWLAPTIGVGVSAGLVYALYRWALRTSN